MRINGESMDSSWEVVGGGGRARGAASGVDGGGPLVSGGDAANVYGCGISGGSSVSIDNGGGLEMYHDSCGEE